MLQQLRFHVTPNPTVFRKALPDFPKIGESKTAFTLIEVLVSTLLFVLIFIGMLSAVTLAYRIALETRYRDRAINALASVADQFQNSPINDKTSAAAKILFNDTAGTPTGIGLAWDNDKQVFVYQNGNPPPNMVVGVAAPDGLTISLGTVASGDVSIPAHILRNVTSPPDPITGVSDPKWLEATFSITYTFPARQQKTLQLKALRYLNKTDL